jgi:hypothetical protein
MMAKRLDQVTHGGFGTIELYFRDLVVEFRVKDLSWC